jgi:titin
VEDLAAAVRAELQLSFDVDLLVPSPSAPGGFAPLLSLDGAPAKLKIAVQRKAAAAARDFVLLVSSTDGTVSASRRCAVTAASVDEVVADLARQLETQGPIVVSYDGAPLDDLASLPNKAKVTVAAAGLSEGVPPAGQRFHLIVSSALFEGQRAVEVSAVDATDLCFAVQTALGLRMQVDVLYRDEDLGQSVYIVELEDLQGITEVMVEPAKKQRVRGSAAALAPATIRTGSPPQAPPGAPILAASTADTLEVQWSAVEGDVDGYNVEKRFAFDEDGWSRIAMRIRGTSACLDGFGPVTSHVFRVVAINAFGESEPGPDSEVLVTKPGVPDTPAAAQVTSSTHSSIALTWEPPKDNGAPVESFTVQQRLSDSTAWTAVGTTAANAIAATKLEPATSYVFRVIAKNSAGASLPGLDSQPITTAPGPPGAAGMPRAVAVSPTSLSIEWNEATDHGSAIQSYSVEYSLADQPGSEWVKVTDCSTTTLTCPQLRPLCGYAFRVTASNAIGVGATGPSSQTIYTEAAAPAKPAAPCMTSVTANSLAIQWDAPDDNNTAITGYRVERRDPGAADWVVVSPFQAQTDLSCSDLKPASSYMFRVTAVSAAGESEVSDSSDRMQTRAAPPSRPFPPTLLQEPLSTALNIGWAEPNDNGSPITSYRCELQMPSGWVVIYEGTSLTANAEGLAPATEYVCRVTAINGEGDSSKGEEALFFTAAERPDPPQAPSLAANSGSELTLAWDEPNANGAQITHYELQQKSEGGASWTTVAANITGTVAAVPKGDQEETVYFRVSASNSAGTSDPSAASEAIRSEAAMRKLMLLVSSESLFTEKKKVAVEAGSIDHLSTALQNKLGLAEPIQVLSDSGMLFSSLDQIADKAKVNVRPLHAVAPAANDGAGKRNFTLLITSSFFADKRKVQVTAGSVAELTSALQQSLGLTQRFAIVIHDEDFDEDRMIADLEDIETDKAKIQLVEL